MIEESEKNANANAAAFQSSEKHNKRTEQREKILNSSFKTFTHRVLIKI